MLTRMGNAVIVLDAHPGIVQGWILCRRVADDVRREYHISDLRTENDFDLRTLKVLSTQVGDILRIKA